MLDIEGYRVERLGGDLSHKAGDCPCYLPSFLDVPGRAEKNFSAGCGSASCEGRGRLRFVSVFAFTSKVASGRGRAFSKLSPENMFSFGAVRGFLLGGEAGRASSNDAPLYSCSGTLA